LDLAQAHVRHELGRGDGILATTNERDEEQRRVLSVHESLKE
jgi:hypothetical protein